MASHIYDLLYSSFIVIIVTMNFTPFTIILLVVLIPESKYTPYLDSKEFLV